MTYSKDLDLSPKFAHFLSEQGMLDSLVIAFQSFREAQNYPFELKDKRIATQAVFKGLCEFYASRGFKDDKLVSSKEILEEAKEVVENIWKTESKTWEKRPEKESTKMVEKKIEKEKKEQDKDKKTYTLDIKGDNKVSDFHTECLAKTKEEAYEIMVKEHPGLGKSSKSAIIKIIKLNK